MNTLATASHGATRLPLIRQAIDSDARIVTVAAPAGFGKTTLLDEWAELDARVTLRLGLRPAHDDPAVLLADIARVCRALAPDEALTAEDPVIEMTALLRRIAPGIAGVLERAALPFVLFIDDVHLLSDAGADALSIVCSRVPDGSQVVLSGRSGMTRFARARMRGNAFEISAQALMVGREGAQQIAAALGTRITDETADQWVRLCDGWAAGLHACALLQAQGSAIPERLIDVPLIADYLYSECLALLPETDLEFLLACSVLRFLSPDLCNAVTERTDGEERLRQLRRHQLFIFPSKEHYGWYQLHDLFREYVLGELRQRRPGLEPQLRRRAARWQAAHGENRVAIEHYLQIGDHDDAARLIEAEAYPTYRKGDIRTVTRWIDALVEEDGVLGRFPQIAILAYWIAALSGEPQLAARRFETVERIEAPENDGADGTSFAATRSVIRLSRCRSGMEAAYADGLFAAETEPFGSPWKDQALQALGAVAAYTDRIEEARSALRIAIPLAEAFENYDTVALCAAELAALAIREDDWEEAANWAQRAVSVAEAAGIGHYPLVALPYAVRARTLLAQSDPAAAQAMFERALLLRTGLTHAIPILAIPARTHLAFAALGLGDRAAADTLLSEVDGLLSRSPQMGTLLADIARIREEAGALKQSGISVALTSAELRVLPYLQTHLNRAEIGERLGISRNTVGTQISAIFRKLGVSDRGAAVQRATELNLIRK